MTDSEYIHLSVGQPFPATPPPMGCHLSMGTGLNLVVRVERPSGAEIRAFRNMRAYGFYTGDDLPQGLLVWYFSPVFFFETPFNPRLEETVRRREMRGFLSGRINACHRILLDQRGTVRALGMVGLDVGLVETLKGIWGDPLTDWSSYEDRYSRLTRTKSGSEIWRQARQWPVLRHVHL